MATDGYFNGATARRAVVRQGAPIVLGRSTFSYFQAGSPRSIWFGLVNAPPSDAPAAPPSNAPALIARSSCVVPHPTSTRAANAIAIPKRAVIIISSARIHRLAVEQDGFRLRSARSRRVGRGNGLSICAFIASGKDDPMAMTTLAARKTLSTLETLIAALEQRSGALDRDDLLALRSLRHRRSSLRGLLAVREV